MNFSLFSALTCLLILAQTSRADDKSAPIDFDKARQLFQQQQSGATLTADERAYLERARAAHDAKEKTKGSPDAGPNGTSDGIDWDRAKDLHRRDNAGEKLSPDDKAYLDKARAAFSKRNGGGGKSVQPTNQRQAPATLKPLSDMTAEDKYEGEDGGLYGQGSNQPPEAQQKSIDTAFSQVQPLNAEGKPDASGKIVLVSISMSNATMEFSAFKRIADADPRKATNLTIVDCAQGGQAMAQWVQPDARPWEEAMNRIQRADVTAQQVQVAWIKLANVAPSGSMSEHLSKLETDTTAVLNNARARFPNLRLAYLGSRIWAGNASTGLNPEPYAYEGAFAVRHLIAKQMRGSSELDTTHSPVLLWGPYLWAEGDKGRKLDDLKWLPTDFGKDGTHPSESGQDKVAHLLLDFFATSPLAKGWFAKK